MKKYLTVSQMVECEQVSSKKGLSLSELMDNAAEGLYRAVTRAAHSISLEKSKSDVSICIIAGKGNNGGDGLVCARQLYESGFDVNIVLAFGEPSTELAIAAYNRLDGVSIINGFSKEARNSILSADIIVDCIFGTGFKGALYEESLSLFECINSSPAYKIACDIPSGCNADTGLCDPDSVKADITVTFHRPKVGMALSPAREHCGGISVCDIGISNACEQSSFEVFEPSLRDIKALLPERPIGAHKGTFGRLLIIAGSENYYGAPALASTAALRCGAGIVQLAAPKSVINALAGSMYECTFLPLEADEGLEALTEAMEKASAILIGCGLGVSGRSRELVKAVISHAQCPVTIDADGLNCLAEDMSVLSGAEAEIILTPHMGELARLCGVSTDEALQSRLELSKSLADKYNAMVVSKSAGTLTVTSGGAFITNYGNTALSKGGSGDMLAGMLASFSAQGAESVKAAILANFLLGRSAEALSETLSERGILARDILDYLPTALFELEK